MRNHVIRYHMTNRLTVEKTSLFGELLMENDLLYAKVDRTCVVRFSIRLGGYGSQPRDRGSIPRTATIASRECGART